MVTFSFERRILDVFCLHTENNQYIEPASRLAVCQQVFLSQYNVEINIELQSIQELKTFNILR